MHIPVFDIMSVYLIDLYQNTFTRMISLHMLKTKINIEKMLVF